MIRRRTFLQSSLAAGTLVAAGCASSPGTGAAAAPAKAAPPPPKKILILGGTGFLGPHIVEAARPRGHVVTLFNRGKTNPGRFTDLEQLHGDRDGKLEALAGRKWDAVIDTSGYVPRVVRQSAELLAPSVGRYLFVSTISVYGDVRQPGMDESAPTEKLPPGEETSEEVRKHYGALKAACEQTVSEVYGQRATNIRPGLIVGPGDPTDRFTYWPARIDRGGEALAPGDGSDPVQFIDGRDLALWIVRCVEEGHAGTFNAVGPGEKVVMKQLIDACVQAAAAPAAVTWVSWPFLEKNEVSPWQDMPVWIPTQGEGAGFGQLSNRAAMARGLSFRPTEEIVRDTLAWWKTLPEERREKLRAGISPEREKEVLAAWKASGGKA
jgi:2'-hydroxyisoflavone reductase